ncbi:MAG: YegP family protein [Ferruginibacter sp.]|nr:YegP family protein [Bacteroidota bacterium]MBX2935321.1 YegP family protein [Ferruginibacter sp.]
MGKFATKTGTNGEYYFNLKADNGQIILSSEGYKTTASRDNGIESVRKNSTYDSKYDKQSSSNGKFYFNLKATNGQVIGKSQMYESEAGRDNGIASVKSNAPAATVVEE